MNKRRETQSRQLKWTSILGAAVIAVALGLGSGCEKGADESAEANPADQAQSESSPSSPGDKSGQAAPSPSDRAADKPPSAGDQKPQGMKRGTPKPSEGAQAPDRPSPSGAQAGGDTQISDDQIEKFLEASSEIQKENSKLRAKVGNASGPEEAKKLQQQAQKKAQSELKEVGLQPKVYVAISKKIQTDPEFKSRVDEIASESMN